MTSQTGAGDRTLDLALGIAKKVKIIITALQKQGLPPPSLAEDAPSPDFLPSGEVDLQNLRQQVVGKARLLADILTGPRKYLNEYCLTGNHQAMTLQVLYQYRLPIHVPLNGSISYADLASACGLDEPRLTRIIRYLILSHIFAEPSFGYVSHSSISRLLATESQSMDFLGHITEDMFSADFHQTRALLRAPYGTSLLDCGASVAFSNGENSFFDILSADPQRMKRFGGAMGFANASGSHTDVATLLTGFDWRAVPSGSRVIDVGGSFGHTARHILRHAPNIRSLTVQDLPDVIEQAVKDPVETDFKDRLHFQPANFFDIQPVTDADIYLCRGILVDWPEEKALDIIRNLVPSMKPGSLLIINEPIIQDPVSGITEPYAAKITRLLDLQMMVALNAYVKSASDWERLATLGSAGKLKMISVYGSVIVLRRISELVSTAPETGMR